ncbi:MAG: MFS transporter [Catenulisporales bacterium]|nr:MFS transporter [Catenulisporales bacterium]
MSAIPSEPVRRVRRDSWTRLLYLQLGAFAFFLYAFSPSINLLKDDLHLSAGVAGLHSTCYAVGVTVGGVCAPWYIRHAGGSRPAVWWSLVGLSLSVALFCAVPALAVTFPAAAVCGVFGAWLCIAVPAALARAHGSDGPAAITEANAVAAFVGIAAPLAVGGAAAVGISWRVALLTVVPLIGLLYLVLGRVREPEWLVPDVEQVVFEAEVGARAGYVATDIVDRESVGAQAVARTSAHVVLPAPRPADHVSVPALLPAAFADSSQASAHSATSRDLPAAMPSPEASEHPLMSLADPALAAPSRQASSVRALPRRFWFNQLAVVCAVSVEFCLTLWCATLLHERAGLSAGVATTGVTAVVAGMAVGRAIGGPLALRMPIDRLIFASFGANLLGFGIFWAAAQPAPMFAGLAVAGLGVALQFPLISARGIELSGGQAELAGAITMFGAGIAVGTGPFVLGFLSDQVGIHAAYLLLPVFIGVAVLAVAGSATTAAGRAPVSETMAA